LEQEKCYQHSKKDARECVLNLEVKLGVQDVKMKKPGRRIAKKPTKGKVAAGTGHSCVHRKGWHRTSVDGH
jgi:hypothetical protein